MDEEVPAAQSTCHSPTNVSLFIYINRFIAAHRPSTLPYLAVTFQGVLCATAPPPLPKTSPSIDSQRFTLFWRMGTWIHTLAGSIHTLVHTFWQGNGSFRLIWRSLNRLCHHPHGRLRQTLSLASSSSLPLMFLTLLTQPLSLTFNSLHITYCKMIG
jgi:hypothetical protein